MEIKTAYIILADGFEEIEALGTMDVLRRLHVFVHSVGLDSKTVRGSHHILVEADETFATAKFDEAFAIILPGGLPGATNLRDSARLRDILRKFNTQGKLLCAICAAPTVLAAAGIASGHTVTGYPGCEELAGVPVKFTGAMVEHDGNLITAKGPGATFLFAAEIARAFGVAEPQIQQVLEGMFVAAK